MYDDIAKFLAILGRPLRFEILLILRNAGDSGATVTEIITQTRVSPSAVSQQLGVLYRAGLVTREKSAQQVTYRIDLGAVRAIIADMASHIREPRLNSAA